MFEASYLNGVEVRCVEHPRNNITSLCMDPKCTENPYLCNQCLVSMGCKQKHYGHDLNLKEMMPAVKELSDSLSRTKKPMETIFNKLNSDKQNSSLMKYQEEREQHFQSIWAHIETIKFQVEEEIRGIVKGFEAELQKEKENMFKELERYYETYREKFDTLSRKIGPVASVTKTYKYYASKNNILLKMMADSDPNSSVKWFMDLKRTAKAAEALSNDPSLEYEKIKKLSSTTNDLMDQLPRIKTSQYESRLPKILNPAAREVLKHLVKFGDMKIIDSISRSNSAQQEYSKSQDISWMSRG